MIIEDLNCGSNVHFNLSDTLSGGLELIAFDPLNGKQETIYMRVILKGKGYEHDHQEWVELGKILEISTGEKGLKKFGGRDVYKMKIDGEKIVE